MSLLARLQDAVDRIVSAEPVPGAIVGAVRGEESAVAAAGVADLRSGAPMTPDTLFLCGSVTKVWQATLLLSLADAAGVDLDAPVVRYLPDFRLASTTATSQVTVRMLLTHSSGIDAADLIVDLGDDDGAITRYVGLLADKEQLHPPGQSASYNNAGFVVAGRIVETQTGLPWAQAMRERLFGPLRLERTVLADRAATPPNTAVGHFPTPDGLAATSRFLLPEALAPAGSTLLVTAADTLEFARMHLAGGVTTSGHRLLPPAAARAMATPHLDWPAPGTGGIALGWWWDPRDAGPLVLSHTGGSLGGVALLAVVPELRLAMVAFVNSTAAPAALPALKRAVLDECLGVPVATPRPRPFVEHVDPARFVGRYRRYGMTIDVRAARGGVELTTTPELDIVVDYLSGQPMTLACRPVGPDALALAAQPGTACGVPVAWLVAGDAGPATYLYVGGRLARRVPTSP